MFVSEAWAQGAAPGAGGGLLEMFLPLILIFAIFYFLLIRPQQKKQKEHRAKLEAVRRGDQVVLGGGIFGQVVKVDEDDTVQVDIADGVRVKVAKSTLMEVMTKGEPAKDDKSGKGKQAANDGSGTVEKKPGGLAGLLGGFGGKKDGDSK